MTSLWAKAECCLLRGGEVYLFVVNNYWLRPLICWICTGRTGPSWMRCPQAEDVNKTNAKTRRKKRRKKYRILFWNKYLLDFSLDLQSELCGWQWPLVRLDGQKHCEVSVVPCLSDAATCLFDVWLPLAWPLHTGAWKKCSKKKDIFCCIPLFVGVVHPGFWGEALCMWPFSGPLPLWQLHCVFRGWPGVWVLGVWPNSGMAACAWDF